ncbi:protein lethal(2)essential for life-like [Schistocerca serialis cubense]|uniref:protein lethal(2)essential for life-like n=1 Tax=Schistocerca serialis cubense TaxID=2023355 RepID=UPI00214E8FAD|nr:protein lethal(2)essential for life-like [Schistocerca serialis cubense]
MAALPLVYRILEELNQPTSQYDQGFGLGLLAALLSRPLRYQPICLSAAPNIIHKEGFEVSLDVQQFRPDEISVKKIDDFIVVEGKHDERKDGHGYVSRQFTRRYRLPDDIEVDQMVSKLSSDGVLTITAPKKTLPPSESRERIVPIVHTNQPAVAQSAPSRESGDNEIQETIVQ